MSGHSKWSTIKRAKGAADVKRGMTFTKLANVITIAAKLGGSGDPESNPRLRMALDQAKAVNFPKDNIQRAIDKGLGKLPGQQIEEVRYEGYGPANAAFLALGATDNKLRTTAEIKNMFDRSGGALGGQGSVAYMFDKIGEIKVKSKGGVKDDEILEIIDLGAEDVEDYEDDNQTMYLVYTESSNLSDMSTKLTQMRYEVVSHEIEFKPNLTVDLTDLDSAKKVLNFAQNLEDHDDIHKVYVNVNIPEEIINNMDG
jgi:YebC/PmpR family DNA-binding regulatory protein